jgi:hypothetical protein
LTAAAVLPVGGTHVRLREPTGEDELLVLAGTGAATATTLALAGRLATDAGGRAIDWLALPAVDLGAVALLIRESWLGTTIRTEALCPAAGCDEPIDVAFGIPAYLDHHRPRRYRGASECEPGWFALAGTEVRFRIPTIADMLEALEALGPVATMLERCVRPVDPPASVLRRIDRALDALAPRLDGNLTGTCPACGQTVDLRFEPISYVLEELRDASTGLFAHVHELAFAYHWSEQSILALDRRRRHGYVAMVRGEYAFA